MSQKNKHKKHHSSHEDNNSSKDELKNESVEAKTSEQVSDNSSEVKNFGTSKSNDAESKYLIPGSIIIAGLIIAFAMSGSGGSSNVPLILDSRVASIAQASGLDAAELQECSQANTYDDNVEADMDNAVATGGGGTPWTIVHDTVEDKYYSLGGAEPIDLLIASLDSNFTDRNFTDEQVSQFAKATPVTDRDYYRGTEGARYVFIEYSDFDCPYCGVFHKTMKELISVRNDVGWVYRDSPIEQIHPDARFVANVMECAGEGGDNDDDFWKAADAYFGVR